VHNRRAGPYELRTLPRQAQLRQSPLDSAPTPVRLRAAAQLEFHQQKQAALFLFLLLHTSRKAVLPPPRLARGPREPPLASRAARVSQTAPEDAPPFHTTPTASEPCTVESLHFGRCTALARTGPALVATASLPIRMVERGRSTPRAKVEDKETWSRSKSKRTAQAAARIGYRSRPSAGCAALKYDPIREVMSTRKRAIIENHSEQQQTRARDFSTGLRDTKRAHRTHAKRDVILPQ
jgi:hypothetical protein